jgi:glycosyltransferase involved in cell wall biosynthesis
MPITPGCKRIVTIHDCIHFRHPETTSALLSLGMRVLLRANARVADRIIAVSSATRDDLVSILRADPARIDVISSGPGADIVPANRSADAVRRALGVPDGPLVLSVSARRPHKNLERLIRAMAHVPDAILVLPGYPTAWDSRLRAAAVDVGVDRRVVLCGWVDDASLEALYGDARCLVFPTLAEGFGLPLLEAMRRGVPVAASDLPVLREIGGTAARYFDPASEQAIGDAIVELLPDSGAREAMIAAGIVRASGFTWTRSAELVAETYRRALGVPASG